MSSANSTCLFMPVEIIERIINETWASSLSVRERTQFMTASLLVNSTWAALFNRISFKHVHIVSLAYLHQYMRILQERSPIYDEETQSLPNRLCESLTINIQPATTGQNSACDELPMGEGLSDLLNTLSTTSGAPTYLPGLRKITIAYEDTGYDDIFDNHRLIVFPSQVTELEINFNFHPQTEQVKRACVQPRSVPWTLPSIHRLSFFGASSTFLQDMVSCCPNVQNCSLFYPAILPPSENPKNAVLPTQYTDVLSSLCGMDCHRNDFDPHNLRVLRFRTGSRQCWSIQKHYSEVAEFR